MDPRALLAEIRQALHEHYGRRLHQVMMFGSFARGDSTPDSDLDLLVVLSAFSEPAGETRSAVDVVYPVLQTRAVFLPLHIVVATQRDYEEGRIALYRSVRREGIAA